MRKVLLLLMLSVSISTYSQDLEKGKTVFTTNCAGCHNMEKAVVGPALQDVVEAQGRDWTRKWIINSQELIGSGDAHANDIYNQYNKQVMPGFSYLPKEDLESLLDYMEGYKADKAAKAAATQPPTDGSTNGNTTKGGGLPFYVWIFLIITLALVVATGFIVTITVRLLARQNTKVMVVNNQLLKQLKISNKEINHSVDKLFNDEVENRLKQKIESLKGDLNDRLKNFK